MTHFLKPMAIAFVATLAILFTADYALSGERQGLEPSDLTIRTVKINVFCETESQLLSLLDNWQERRAAGHPGEGCTPVRANVPFVPVLRYMDDEGDLSIVGVTMGPNGAPISVFTLIPGEPA